MIEYERDFYGWTQEQAALLKSGRLADLDVTNLIEEIETMGRSERRELESRMTVLMAHLLKWQYQPDRRGRSWLLTIKGQRISLERVIRDNPGLKPEVAVLMADAYQSAALEASKQTRFDEAVFPATCPWTLEQLMDSNFLPE